MTGTLTAGLVTALFGTSRDTTDRLVAVMREQIAAADAHRQAVEHGVAELLAADYAPTAAAIQRAVSCPDPALIDFYRQEPTS